MDKDLGSEDIKTVYKQIRAAKAEDKWEQIGLGLGLSPATVKSIRETQNRDNPRLYSTLSTWVNEKKLQTTWRVLVNTLRSEDVNESALADRVLAEKGIEPLEKRVQKPLVAPAIDVRGEPVDGQKTLAANCDLKIVAASDRLLLDIEDLNQLYDLVKEASSHWYDIGLRLSFKVGELDAIQNMPLLIVQGTEGYLRELLCRWLKHTSPYLQDLATAIYCAGNERLGDELVGMYSTANKQTKGTTSKDQSSELEVYLRRYYSKSSQHTETEWPPTLDVEYINLVMIEQNQLLAYTEQQCRKMELISKGEIQGILEELQFSNIDITDIVNYSTPKRKVIIIEGAPGIGKTTLALKLCKDWADDRLLTEFSLVFYIPLRMVPRLRVAESVADLMEYLVEDCSPADLQAVRNKLGARVLFVLDGWDELPRSCRDEDMFFPKLVRGKPLPECSIIVTSRPGVTADIRRHANRFIEILGFTEDQVKQYIHSYIGQYDQSTSLSTNYAAKLIDDLEEYPNVASTCYIAINLTIVCYVYCASDYKLPPTLSEVYEQFILHAIKRHLLRANEKAQVDETRGVNEFDCKVKAVLNSLGKLALQGIRRNDLSFTKKQMAEVCQVDEIETQYGFGLLKILHVYRTEGTETLFQFLHLTVQEYLAAYSIAQMRLSELFDCLSSILNDCLSSKLNDDRFGTVLKFFCGMDKFQSSTSRAVFSNSKWLATPMVLECIFEGQWEGVCHKVAQQTHSVIRVPRTIQPYRSLVFGYVMTKSKTQWTLQRYCCEIGEHEAKSLCRYLLPTQRTLCCLHIEKAIIAPKAVPYIKQIIQSQVGLCKLILTKAHINDKILSNLSEALQNHRELGTLHLSCNVLTSSSSETVCILLERLPSLQILDLSQNRLGEDCCRTILTAAASKEPLAKLYLPTSGKDILQEIELLNTSRKERGLHELMVYTHKQD